MSKQPSFSQVRLDALNRLDGAIGTIVPPTERLHTLSDAELLGYADTLWGHWKDLGDEWTRRQMAREGMQRSGDEHGPQLG